MGMRFGLSFGCALACLFNLVDRATAPACCAVGPGGLPVLNADQTVVIVWDAAKRTQHFIRKASFHSEAENFGFLIPSPSTPELAESGNAAFPFLADLTKPEIEYKKAPRQDMGCGCIEVKKSATGSGSGGVNVLLKKEVAGFHAVVLDASTTNALVAWLRENEYAFSPQVEAWARPYVDKGWKITALKVAKSDEKHSQSVVSAAALRMSFATEQPLFPYREPDYGDVAAKQDASRLLRIFFASDKRYDGKLGAESAWTGRTVWSNALATGDRTQLLETLNIADATFPSPMILTEFEDDWAYSVAPSDVYFAPSQDQTTLKRPPYIVYTASAADLVPHDITAYAIVAVIVVPVAWARRRRATRHQ
ncbi:MAG: hypothetical protein C0483_07065 [Pirellula sp.]|nr:hypothetical protein [Pirellula sp.]